MPTKQKPIPRPQGKAKQNGREENRQVFTDRRLKELGAESKRLRMELAEAKEQTKPLLDQLASTVAMAMHLSVLIEKLAETYQIPANFISQVSGLIEDKEILAQAEAWGLVTKGEASSKALAKHIAQLREDGFPMCIEES